MVTLLATIVPVPPCRCSAVYPLRRRTRADALCRQSTFSHQNLPAPCAVPSGSLRSCAATLLCNFLVRSALTASPLIRRALGTRLAQGEYPQRPRGLSVRIDDATLN